MNPPGVQKLTGHAGVLGRAGRALSEFQYPFGEWLFLLRKTFMHSRKSQVPPEDEGGVQVLGIGRAPACTGMKYTWAASRT